MGNDAGSRPGFREMRLHERDLAGEVGERPAARAHPPVGVAHAAREGGVGVRAEDDRRMPRPRRDARVRDVVERAGVAGRRLPPQRADRLHLLDEPRDAPLRRDAVHRQFVAVVTEPDPKHEPPAAHHVDVGGQLRQHHRVVARQHEHRHPDAGGRRLPREPREERERVEDGGRAGDALLRPEAGVAQLLGAAHVRGREWHVHDAVREDMGRGDADLSSGLRLPFHS